MVGIEWIWENYVENKKKMEEGSPPPPEFWESLFLGSSNYDIILHAIVPTVFVTLSGQVPVSNDEIINKARMQVL
jgi:hypothetical protein